VEINIAAEILRRILFMVVVPTEEFTREI